MRASGLSTSAPRAKITLCESLGARVLREGESFEAASAAALRLSEQRGWRFLHPFDNLDVMAGQGTVGLELLDARPDVVAVPVGGGAWPRA